jgi:hypothetical protein
VFDKHPSNESGEHELAPETKRAAQMKEEEAARLSEPPT